MTISGSHPALTVVLCVLDHVQAMSVGHELLLKKYMVIAGAQWDSDGRFRAVSGDTLFRLLEDDPHSALNTGQTASCSSLDGTSGSGWPWPVTSGDFLRPIKLSFNLFPSSPPVTADTRSIRLRWVVSFGNWRWLME